MANVEARIKAKGKNFEILVDVDKAIQLRRGVPVSMENVLAVDQIFTDVKKGLKPSIAELKNCFGTEDTRTIADKIIRHGEILLPAEYRKKEHEARIKQVIDFISRNAIDPTTGRPHTSARIEKALEEAGVNVENRPVEEQITKILDKIKLIIPIRIETKRLKIVIPAVHTGKAYGLLQEYKESEDWLGNGDLLCIVNLPAGLQMEFYDKLNAITHGSALVEEIKEQ